MAGLRAGLRDLSADEQRAIDELKRRDQEVRRHEQAHAASAGRYANGGPNFEFTTGPDGRQYATGGHVRIDVSPANTPEATIQKAQVIRRAALAPAEPSAQDRSVAAAASKLEIDARRQIQEERQSRTDGSGVQGGERAVGPNAAEEAPKSALEPPPAPRRRDFTGYTPGASGAGQGGISSVRRLDVLA